MAEWKAEVLYNFDSTNEVELGLKVRACFLPHCSYVEQPKPPHSPYPALLPPTSRAPSRRQKGEIVVIRRTSVGEGWYEAERNGARGLVPMKFVRKVRPVTRCYRSPH